MARPIGEPAREVGLREEDLATDWLAQFGRWFTEAARSGVLAEPNAMVLATASVDGVPSARTVLLKGYDRRGMTFFTNHGSRKGRELAANPVASLVFSWPALRRQIVVCGRVARLTRQESAAYFASRPYGSRLATTASPQSTVIGTRAELDAFVDRASAAHPEGTEVPVPHCWGGFRVMPDTVEFWQGRTYRLHDRLRFRRTGGEDWVVERLAP